MLLLVAAAATARKTSYAAHKVFRLTSTGHHFARNFTTLATDLDIPVWREPGPAGDFADVQVPPEMLLSFEEAVKGWADLHVMHEDLEASIAQEANYPEYKRTYKI